MSDAEGAVGRELEDLEYQVGKMADMRDAARADAERLAGALDRAIRELGGRHTGHWDRTSQGGLGCPVCQQEGDTKRELDTILRQYREETR